MKTKPLSRFVILVLALLPSFGFAQTAIYTFKWPGSGGYNLSGAMQLDTSTGANILTQDQVMCFEIFGFQNEDRLGQWYLSDRNPATTWVLNFDLTTSEFLVFGQGENSEMPQAWNMNGAGVNCGDPGFGFNIGNAAQDICVDGELIFESQVAPSRALPAQRVDVYEFTDPGCSGPLLLSQIAPQF